MSAPLPRGPYMNEDGDWWVAVEDVPSFAAARKHVVMHIDGGLDPANCDETCRRDALAYHFEENRR